jgi:hypothetical protein
VCDRSNRDVWADALTWPSSTPSTHFLSYEGRSWTFEKKVAGGEYCWVCLDRALPTAEWCNRFPFHVCSEYGSSMGRSSMI